MDAERMAQSAKRNEIKLECLKVSYREGERMTEIIEGVYFIAGVDDMIPDSHVYVIGEPSSQDLSIIDAGLMGKGNYKLQTIKKAGIKVEDVKRIIMTHIHLDHIG